MLLNSQKENPNRLTSVIASFCLLGSLATYWFGIAPIQDNLFETAIMTDADIAGSLSHWNLFILMMAMFTLVALVLYLKNLSAGWDGMRKVGEFESSLKL